MNDVVRALVPVVEALEELGVRYRVGGSVASSALGVPRSTLDVDVACEIGQSHVAGFVARLRDRYYIDADMISDAIARRSSFNLIHLETMLKIDVFVRKTRAFDVEAFGRVTRKQLETVEGARWFDLTTAEDIVLHKLEWYRAGGGVSERQWTDVLGVLRIQGSLIDADYMRRWAHLLGLGDLLERALAEASDNEPGQQAT